MKNKIMFFGAIILFLFSAVSVRANEIKIVFSGQSHSCLYPCNCIDEPDGGVARRATLIKKIRSASSDAIVVEAGLSFASGREDQYSQNYELDEKRTQVYLRCLEKMDYDALLVSSMEYIFGESFLKQFKNLPFVTSNIEGFERPYVIKEVNGVKVGILGITDEKSSVKVSSVCQIPAIALKEKIDELKSSGVKLIVLLSSLRPEQDKELLGEVKGIDIVINGSNSFDSVKLDSVDGVYYLSTWWQAKKIGILSFDFSDGVIKDAKLENIRLSDELSDDEDVLSVLPACFQDRDCKAKQGLIPKCKDGSSAQAACVYIEPKSVSLTIVAPRQCLTCHIDMVIKQLKMSFGEGVKINTIYEDNPEALRLIKAFNVTMLPAYFFGSDVEKSQIFPSYRPYLEEGDDFFMIKPGISGVSYLLGRRRIDKRLDVFFNLDYDQLPKLFETLRDLKNRHKDLDIKLHYLAIEGKDGSLIAKGGKPEVEEFERIACVEDIAPDKLFDYLVCRVKQNGSTWWDECTSPWGIASESIKKCVFSGRADELVKENIKMTEDLKIASGPTFVINNKEIFSIVNVPAIEELEALFYPMQEKSAEKAVKADKKDKEGKNEKE